MIDSFRGLHLDPVVGQNFDDLDQLDNRSGLHLAHHLAAMESGGNVADADGPRGLLVRLTRSSQHHYLTLARSKRFESLPNPGKHLVAFTSSPIVLNGQQYCLDQSLVAVGLRQKFHRASLHCLDGHRDVGVTREEDDRRAVASASKLALKIQAARSSLSYIQDDATWRIDLFPLQVFSGRSI